MAAHTYNDDATIIAGSAEIAVRAELRKHYTKKYGEGWSGTLFPDDPSVDLYPLHENDVLTLRLPDGSEGTFTCDWTSVDEEADQIDIDGSGRPPF